MHEQWTRWEPILNLAKSYYIESVHNDKQGFKIILRDENYNNKSIEVMFENSVYSYACTDDTSIGTIINKLYSTYGAAFYRDWTFFKVSNSHYIQRLIEQSYDVIRSRPLIHFSFITVDSMLDIIADYEPKVVLITAEGNNEQATMDDNDEAQDVPPSATSEDIDPNYKGKFGILPDGREVNLRNSNIAKVPTLETYDPLTKKSIKIRYTK
jgi:hypothetical protein